MKKRHITLIALLVVVGSISTAYATITQADNVNVLGQLTVVDGNLIVQHTDGGDGGFSTRALGAQNVFQFIETSGGQVYRFVLNDDGSEFAMRDFTHGNRADLVVKTATGNVGIGEPNPQERLDVGGNLHVRDGTITADGDICIGACP